MQNRDRIIHPKQDGVHRRLQLTESGVCGSLPLSAASTSPSPFAANGSPLVLSAGSAQLIFFGCWSCPARLRLHCFRPVPRYPTRPQVPLGLLVVFEGWFGAQTRACSPSQRPPVPAPSLEPKIHQQTQRVTYSEAKTEVMYLRKQKSKPLFSSVDDRWQ